MYRHRYRRYFFSKVLIPISSLLLKYRVPSSGRKFSDDNKFAGCVICTIAHYKIYSVFAATSCDLAELSQIPYFSANKPIFRT